jgi:hypothetical protein
VIAVYTFFLTSLLSNQYINTEESPKSTNSLKLDYIPILITLQFIFYMGWLKVAETMINPFGSDDDDFEVNYLIDRNLQMSYIIVDDMHHDHPVLLKDQYWDQIPTELPDRGRGERRTAQILQSDIFDVDENNRKSMPRISKRPTNVFVNMDEDEFTKIPTPSKDSLKPRADVIDKNYHRLSNVQESQITLEREMEKARSQITLPSASSQLTKKSSSSLRKL